MKKWLMEGPSPRSLLKNLFQNFSLEYIHYNPIIKLRTIISKANNFYYINLRDTDYHI